MSLSNRFGIRVGMRSFKPDAIPLRSDVATPVPGFLFSPFLGGKPGVV